MRPETVLFCRRNVSPFLLPEKRTVALSRHARRICPRLHPDQNLDLQRDALTRAGCERLFEEKKSGKAGTKRPAFEAALPSYVPRTCSWSGSSIASAAHSSR